MIWTWSEDHAGHRAAGSAEYRRPSSPWLIRRAARLPAILTPAIQSGREEVVRSVSPNRRWRACCRPRATWCSCRMRAAAARLQFADPARSSGKAMTAPITRAASLATRPAASSTSPSYRRPEPCRRGLSGALRRSVHEHGKGHRRAGRLQPAVDLVRVRARRHPRLHPLPKRLFECAQGRSAQASAWPSLMCDGSWAEDTSPYSGGDAARGKQTASNGCGWCHEDKRAARPGGDRSL